MSAHPVQPSMLAPGYREAITKIREADPASLDAATRVAAKENAATDFAFYLMGDGGARWAFDLLCVSILRIESEDLNWRSLARFDQDDRGRAICTEVLVLGLTLGYHMGEIKALFGPDPTGVADLDGMRLIGALRNFDIDEHFYAHVAAHLGPGRVPCPHSPAAVEALRRQRPAGGSGRPAGH